MSGSRSPWRFPPSGVRDTSGAGLHPFSGLPLHSVHQVAPDGLGGVWSYANQFVQWEGPTAEGAAGGWLLSGVTGAATIVLTAVPEGEIAITADATANCDPTLQLGATTAAMPLRYAVGKRLWCHARLKMGTVASTEFFFGVGTADTEPTTTNTFPADGIFFHKAASATKLSFDARKDGTSTSKATISGTLVDATYTTIGFSVDLKGNILPYQDGALIAAGVIAAGTANIPSAGADTLTFMVGFRGASQVVTLDWLILGQEK